MHKVKKLVHHGTYAFSSHVKHFPQAAIVLTHHDAGKS